MHLTYEDTLDLLKKAVDSKPEGYRYTRDPKAIATAKSLSGNGLSNAVGIDNEGEFVRACHYRNFDDTPGCIVGNVIYDIAPDFKLEETSWNKTLLPDGITIDDKASWLLSNAQMRQDSGMTWAEAVAGAVTEIEASFEEEDLG